MSGSHIVPIIVPIVSVICLATWLIIIYWADAHPEWRNQRTRDEGTAITGVPQQGRLAAADVPSGAEPAAPPPGVRPDVPRAREGEDAPGHVRPN